MGHEIAPQQIVLMNCTVEAGIELCRELQQSNGLYRGASYNYHRASGGALDTRGVEIKDLICLAVAVSQPCGNAITPYRETGQVLHWREQRDPRARFEPKRIAITVDVARLRHLRVDRHFSSAGCMVPCNHRERRT